MKKKAIALKWALALCFFFYASVLLAQIRTIEGRIAAQKDHTPLGGATILVLETGKSTFSKADGSFLVEAQSGNKIKVDYTGYESQTVTISDADTLFITLAESATNLDEVVVVGYGTQSRHDLSGAVATVNPLAFKSSPTSNVGTVLQGTVPGLRVSQSTGQPGTTPSITFRGGTGFDGSGSPLIVVDGIIIPSLYGLNMDDIASINLLKDASSTAIYGARGANGVLLITTKKGQKGRTRVTYTVRQTNNYQRKNSSQYLNGAQYISLNRQGLRSRYLLDSLDGNTNAMNTDIGQNAGSWGWAVNSGFSSPVGLYTTQLVNDQSRHWIGQPGWNLMVDPNPFNPTQMDSIIYRDLSVDDRENMIMGNQNSTEHSLNFSGADDMGNFSLGLGAVKDNGTIIGSYLKRLNMNFNGGLNVGKNLKVTLTTSAYSVNQGLPYTDPLGGAAGGLLQRFIGVAPTVRYNNDTSGVALPGPNDNTLGNPNYWSQLYVNSTTQERFAGGLTLDWTILPFLKFVTTGSGYYQFQSNNYFTKAYQTGNGGAMNTTRPASFTNSKEVQYLYNGFLEFNKTFNGNHHFSAMAGGEFYDIKDYAWSGSAQGAPTDLIPWLNADPAPTVINGALTNPQRAASDFSGWDRMISAIGRINYSYKDLYFLTANFRYDGSDRLSPSNHYGFFPGVSVGWNMQNENFFKNSSIGQVVSTFKPRISYGANGNIGSIAQFATAQVYNPAGTYNGAGGSYVSSYINPNLLWESVKSTNFGADIGLFNNRITILGDYFVRNVYDKAASEAIDLSTGFANFTTNLGQLQNKGWELTLNAKIIEPKRTDGLGIDFTANFYTVKNYAVKLPDNGLPGNRQGGFQVWDPNNPGQLMYVGQIQEGQRINTDEVWAPKWDGIYKTQAQLDADANVYNAYSPLIHKNVKQLGDAIWHQVNPNDTLDQRQFVYVGRTTPSITGSFATNITYKGFSLYGAFDYAFGFVVINNEVLRGLNQVQGSQNSTTEALNTWTPQNSNATLPRYYWANQGRNYATDASGNNPPANLWQKGDYVALRELTLSYDFSRKLLQAAFASKVKALRLFISGGNLAYFTQYSGNLPEVGGVDNGHYPLPRRVTFGATVSL